MSNMLVLPDRQAGNGFLGSFKDLQIQALATLASGIGSLESIPPLQYMKNQDEDDFFLIEATKKESICSSTIEGTKAKRSIRFSPRYRRNEDEAKYSFLNYQ